MKYCDNKEHTMNPKIQTFLDNYTCEETKPGVYSGHFSNTRMLHIVRDNLSTQDWMDIRAEVTGTFYFLPNNLQLSLNQKFNELIEFTISENAEHISIGEILPVFKTALEYNPSIKDKYELAQKLIWGALTSCIECIYWRDQHTVPVSTVDIRSELFEEIENEV